jgi:hypothetical protein
MVARGCGERVARRLGLTSRLVDFRVRSLAPPSYLFLFIIVDVGILYQVHKLEAQGWKVKKSSWVRCCIIFHLSESIDAKMLSLRLLWYYIFVGHCRPRTFPHHHRIVLPRSAGCYTRYEYSPRYVSLLRGSHRGSSLSSLVAHALPHVCNMHFSLRCVESRIVRGASTMVRGA